MWDLISNPMWGNLVLLHMGLTCLAHRRTIAQFLDDCSDGNVERLERERLNRIEAKVWLGAMGVPVNLEEDL
jgi:hypothetical protein